MRLEVAGEAERTLGVVFTPFLSPIPEPDLPSSGGGEMRLEVAGEAERALGVDTGVSEERRVRWGVADGVPLRF